MIGEPRLPDTVQTIAETLAFWAERTPQAPALVTPGRPPITYAALCLLYTSPSPRDS